MLEMFKELLRKLTVIVVELKKQTSIQTRQLDTLENIDKSLSQGKLQKQLQYFMSEFAPEIGESHAVRMREEQRQNLRQTIRKARERADASESSNKVSEDTEV